MDGGGGQESGAGMGMFIRNYKLGKTLGFVSMVGKKKIAEHAFTGQKVIIEILKRAKIKNMEMEEQVKLEIEILRLLKHPRIIKLYEVIETPTHICVVMEYTSTELFDYIIERGRLEEDQARNIFSQILSGVEYCHHNNMVVHRDLRPENILLDFKCDVKIAGFGCSNIMHGGHFLKTSYGSSNYAPPEVICGKLNIGPEVDVWSCGVVLYFLLCGVLPFHDENIPNLFNKIKGGVFTFPCYLSPGARDLISKMLNVDPIKRMTISQIQQHPWFHLHLQPALDTLTEDTM